MIPKDLATATAQKPVRVGRYDVTGFIGAGGMGAVHDAVDREHGTRVALKTLSHLSAANLVLFKTEFRSVADLSHRNLVPLYELSCHDDLWFFTMERVDGADFITSLRSRHPMPPDAEQAANTTPDGVLTATTARERDLLPNRVASSKTKPSPPPSIDRVREAFGQLVAGVRALHAAGLLHLDLKPSNVLIDATGKVVVVDFGLVRAIGREDASCAEAPKIYGTPGWMAPEQQAGGKIGRPADWYAVGLLLYLALTGVSAFDEVMPAVLFGRERPVPIPPDRLLPELPADLCALALALLDPDPSARPTGEELAAFVRGDATIEPSSSQSRARRITQVFGREDERARLFEALRHVRARGSAIVHLVGPSGVGKTTLLTAFADEARDGARVLRGRCYERESVPYKAFDGMLDQLVAQLATRPETERLPELPAWIAELSRVFPVLASVPDIALRIVEGRLTAPIPVLELRRRAVEALRELFITLAAEKPLVLAIDDLHWADADSTTLLGKLLEAPVPEGLLLAASYRVEEANANAAIAPYLHAVDELDGRPARGRFERVTLEIGPLPPAEAERLASATLATLDVDAEGLSGAIADEAAGNPFYIEELAHYLAHRPDRDRSSWKTGVALEAVLARRLESLASAERALVDVLAVANHPIPLSVSFAVAGIAGGVLRALWSLRSGHFVRSTGSSAADRVELHHDGMRAAVLLAMSNERQDALHLALGRAFRDAASSSPDSASFIFDAARHLGCVPSLLIGEERIRVAELQLRAGRQARLGAAFPLSFDCFRSGTELLDETAWEHDYPLALALHSGAAEAAYLSSEWGHLDAHIAAVKAHGRTILDQLVAWEVQIDACIARREYDAAVDAALEALQLLDVGLPAHPTEAQVGVELQRAMESLARVAPAGLSSLPHAKDPTVLSAMRLQARISSAAYFARPMLLPVIACRLVATSASHGLSSVTPYALSVYGIVLNSLGMLREAHSCGRVALALLEQFDDRSFEARTRHVVNDLVCVWLAPLRSTLDDLRSVIAVGRETGDLEYASYAAHAYVHNAFYAGRELEGLLTEALSFGTFMRGYGQVNALHVHAPFEQVLRCFTGRAANPASLDGDGFDEAQAIAIAEASGSRSAQCIVRLLMGIVRYHFGSVEDASACLEGARPFLDGVVSTWHSPIFHQYAALAIHSLPAERRTALRAPADASLAALSQLAAQAPDNFAHRVHLVEAERARADGDLEGALRHCATAIEQADAQGFTNDVALAHELAARCHVERRDAASAARHARSAGAAYQRLGARAKIA